jgi:16S rRNA G527 N7-methylase RsmG
VIHDRLENFVADPAVPRDRDGFTSRATMAIAPTLALAAPLIIASGSAFLWKGSGAEVDMAADPSWRDAWDYSATIPVGLGPNVVVRFVRK